MNISALSLSLTRPGGISLEQLVAGLFAAGEQGAWYDPSGNNTTWRRNLLTYTEQFDNAAWTATTVAASAVSSPDANAPGAMFAINSANDSANSSSRYVGQSQTIVPSTQYTFSFYAKAGGISSVRFLSRNDDATRDAYFSLTGSGSVTSSTNTTPSIQSIGNGIYRCIVSWVSGADTSILCSINSGVTVFGDGSTMFYVSAPQFERSLTATAYQRIVTPEITYLADVQSQPLLFTDSTGAAPVTGVEQPVGLILDKRKGLVLGPERVTNGTFDTDLSGWITDNASGTARQTTWTASGVRIQNDGSGNITFRQEDIFEANKWYKVTFSIVVASGSIELRRGGTALATISSSGSYSYITSGTALERISFLRSGVCDVTIDNISVKLLDGNHAYQTGSAARPVLRARYNLLTYSEQFDNAGWTKTNLNAFGSGSVVNTTATTAPDGTNTAEFIQESTANSFHQATQQVNAANATYTLSCYLKAAGRTQALISMSDASSGDASWGFNLSTEQLVTYAIGIGSWTSASAAIVSVGNGWYRCSVTATKNAGTSIIAKVILFDGTNFSYTGDGTSGIYIWGADLRVGTSAGDYQRIEAAPTATSSTAGPVTYALISTTTGRPFKPYLAFDGVDDVMIAPMDAADWINCTIASGLKFNFLGGTNQCPACVANSATSNSFAYIKDASNVLAWGMTIREDGAANGGAEVFANSNLLPHILYGASSPSAVSIECDNSVSTGGTTLLGPITANRIGLGALTRSGVGAYANHNMYGTIFVRRVLTAAERVSVRNYLADKTGVTL